MSEVKLRRWQEEAVEFADSTPGHRLVAAPPGAGKTCLGYRAAKLHLARSRRNRVVWSVPSIYLVEQTRGQAFRHVEVPVFVDRADTKSPPGARLIVTTHATALRRMRLMQGIEDSREVLYVNDEAHHIHPEAPGGYLECARHWNCLGLSASAWQPGARDAWPKQWQLKLSRALAESPPIIRPIVEYAGMPTDSIPYTIRYYDSVDAAKKAALARRGISFTQGDPETKLLPWLRGRVHDVCVCMRLGEGADVPDCARVVFERRVKSTIWAYQAVGRAMRWTRGGKAVGEAWGVSGPTQEALVKAWRLAGR